MAATPCWALLPRKVGEVDRLGEGDFLARLERQSAGSVESFDVDGGAVVLQERQDLLPVGYNDLASTRAATLGRSLTDAISGTGAAAVNVEVSLWVESVAAHDNRQSPTRDHPGP